MDLLTLAAVNLTLAVALILALQWCMRFQGHQRALRYWQWAGLFLLINSVLSVLSESMTLPYALVPGVTNTATGLLHVTILLGSYAWLQQRPPYRLLCSWLLLFLVVLLLPNMQADKLLRVSTQLSFIAVLNSWNLWFVLRHYPRGSKFSGFNLVGISRSLWLIALSFNVGQILARVLVLQSDTVHSAPWASLIHQLGWYGLSTYTLLFSAAMLSSVLAHWLSSLEQQADTDALTGSLNRHALNRRMQAEQARAMRLQQPLSLIMLDLDHFKRLNDTYGHQYGDLVLCRVGQLLNEQVRGYDAVFRLGGEEFLLLLSNTDATAAADKAEAIRQAIAELTLAEHPQLQSTASLGVLTIPGADMKVQSLPQWLSWVDRALYQAKHQGRNCWVVATP